MKKRFSALLLAMVMSLSCLCVTAFAAGGTLTGKYDESGNLTITGGGFKDGEDVYVSVKDENGDHLIFGAGTADGNGDVNINLGSSLGTDQDLTFDAFLGEDPIPDHTDKPIENESKPEKPTPEPTPDPPPKPEEPSRPSIPSYPDYVIGGGSEGTKKPSVKTYAISVPSNVAHGTVSVLWPSAAWGDTVTITATPEAGYELDTLTVTAKDGNELTVTDRGNNKYTFVMPEGEVSIQASFKVSEKKQPTITTLPATIPFTDVAPGSWYYDAVRFVYGKGMMNGTSPTAFSPNATTSRGMIVTILYRLEGEPAAGTASFTDVPAGQWYSKAVAWAAQNGIVDGYSSSAFGPNDNITREQMAAILYRYASYKGYSVTASSSTSNYSDASQISSYAQTAMSWANATGLITGTSSTTLAPKGNATRAQAAMILMRFCEVVVR